MVPFDDDGIVALGQSSVAPDRFHSRDMDQLILDRKSMPVFDNPQKQRALRPEQSGKGSAISPQQKEPDRADAHGHPEARTVEKGVKEKDVHDDGTEQGQTERNETSDDQECSAQDL